MDAVKYLGSHLLTRKDGSILPIHICKEGQWVSLCGKDAVEMNLVRCVKDIPNSLLGSVCKQCWELV